MPFRFLNIQSINIIKMRLFLKVNFCLFILENHKQKVNWNKKMETKILTINDAQQIHFISTEQFREESWSLEQICNSLDNNTNICVGVFVDDSLACYAIAQNSLDDVNLLLIATQEKQKQKGYAKLLLTYLEDVAKKGNKTFSL